ncbi:MAG: metalloregulator ArsR/SmtB family transcription factor [Candidatus Nanopelagicales bacterium]|nr:transcriptional regulator [Candidatus Nanopelagicales bacterium]
MKSPMTGAAARVARTLLDSGPATASALATELNLTGTAVRRHLDGLVAAGYAQANDRAPFGPTKPRGRGRPARVYTLTSAGRDAFDQAYDDLALAAIRHIAENGSAEAVMDFARGRAADMRRRYSESVSAGNTLEERAALLAQELRVDGFAASVERGGDMGVQICQHHCPVAHVAEEFPQLCEAETEAFSELIGAHVTRLATLSHGDGVCTTHVPLNPATEHVRPERTLA